MANRLLVDSCRVALDQNSLWIARIREVFEQNGMLTLYLSDLKDKPIFIYRKFLQTLCDQFHQTTFSSIKDEGSKPRTYALLKTEIGMEKYLTNVKEYQGREDITRLRLSNHNLTIEIGRYQKIPKDKRFCPFCPTVVESEVYFLIECPTYSSMRNPIITSGRVSMFPLLSSEEKSTYLMANPDRDIAKLVANCFSVRNFLLTNPKRSMEVATMYGRARESAPNNIAMSVCYSNYLIDMFKNVNISVVFLIFVSHACMR